ncbi:MAG: cell division protein ZapA [Myxococcales bacterium]|nr:cell division protein ZapA [Myxococcales bacterium]
MSRPVRISLLGQTFTLRTDETDAHIQSVAALVDVRLKELQAQGAPGDRTLGLFAALTLADELLKCRERSAALDGRIRSRIEAIESVLGEPVSASSAAAPSAQGATAG